MRLILKKIVNGVLKFFRQLPRRFVRGLRAIKETLALGDAPRNLGITDQTVVTVASAAVPTFLPPWILEFVGTAAKGAIIPILSWLSQHGVSGAAWIVFKLSLVSPIVIGSSLAVCGTSILILAGMRLLLRLDKRFSVVANFADGVRTCVNWLGSMFQPVFSF